MFPGTRRVPAGYIDRCTVTNGEFFIVTEGSLWLDDVENGPGSVNISRTDGAAPATRSALLPRRQP
jgi:hypothetical protein